MPASKGYDCSFKNNDLVQIKQTRPSLTVNDAITNPVQLRDPSAITQKNGIRQNSEERSGTVILIEDLCRLEAQLEGCRQNAAICRNFAQGSISFLETFIQHRKEEELSCESRSNSKYCGLRRLACSIRFLMLPQLEAKVRGESNTVERAKSILRSTRIASDEFNLSKNDVNQVKEKIQLMITGLKDMIDTRRRTFDKGASKPARIEDRNYLDTKSIKSIRTLIVDLESLHKKAVELLMKRLCLQSHERSLKSNIGYASFLCAEDDVKSLEDVVKPIGAVRARMAVVKDLEIFSSFV